MNKIVLVLAALLAVSTPCSVSAQNNVNPVPADTGKEKPKPPTIIRGTDCGDACNHSGVTIIRGGAHPSITENPK